MVVNELIPYLPLAKKLFLSHVIFILLFLLFPKLTLRVKEHFAVVDDIFTKQMESTIFRNYNGPSQYIETVRQSHQKEN